MNTADSLAGAPDWRNSVWEQAARIGGAERQAQLLADMNVLSRAQLNERLENLNFSELRELGCALGIWPRLQWWRVAGATMEFFPPAAATESTPAAVERPQRPARSRTAGPMASDAEIRAAARAVYAAGDRPNIVVADKLVRERLRRSGKRALAKQVKFLLGEPEFKELRRGSGRTAA